jgi:hypothetical protein
MKKTTSYIEICDEMSNAYQPKKNFKANQVSKYLAGGFKSIDDIFHLIDLKSGSKAVILTTQGCKILNSDYPG